MKNTLPILACLIVLSTTSIFGQGKFSGYMFGDYYYNVLRDSSFYHTALSNSASGSAAPGPQAMQAFQLRRIYLAYDNDISEQFTTRFRLEADQIQETVDGTKSPVAASKISVFVKDAYLKWKNIFSGSDLIFGIQPPPAYEVSEAAWGYRSLEKTIMDLRGIVSSRDQGVSLKGKITDDGMLDYWVMVANNSGNSPETDKYKRYYAHLQYKPTSKLQGTIYYDFKDQVDGVNSYTKQNIGKGVSTAALFIGYNEPFTYSIGVEGFLQSTPNALKDTLSKSYLTQTQIGISVFGSYTLIPELALVLRYDYYNPSSDSKGTSAKNVTASVANGNLTRNYLIGALSWKVDKNVSIMPNILYETYQAPTGHGTPDPSITARVTLYYIFI